MGYRLQQPVRRKLPLSPPPPPPMAVITLTASNTSTVYYDHGRCPAVRNLHVANSIKFRLVSSMYYCSTVKTALGYCWCWQVLCIHSCRHPGPPLQYLPWWAIGLIIYFLFSTARYCSNYVQLALLEIGLFVVPKDLLCICMQPRLAQGGGGVAHLEFGHFTRTTPEPMGEGCLSNLSPSLAMLLPLPWIHSSFLLWQFVVVCPKGYSLHSVWWHHHSPKTTQLFSWPTLSCLLSELNSSQQDYSHVSGLISTD